MNEPPNPSDRPSIFSRPDPDRDGEYVPTPRPLTPPSTPPAYSLDTRGEAAPEPGGRWGSRQQTIVFGSMALAIVALSGFIAVSLLRPSADVVAVAASPTPTTSASAAAASPSAEPSGAPASAEPTAEPTPAGPPAEVAVGGWATVTVGELNVRTGAGADHPSNSSLIRGAVVNVSDGPTVVDGANWYRIASLGGASGWAASGWIAEPFLETLVDDPTLIRCGEVTEPVFEVVNGSPVAHEPLRIGTLALPAAAFSDVSLGILELMRGMGQEACISAQLGGNGVPVIGTTLNVQACGHAAAEGSFFRLRPAADGVGSLESQVKDPVVVHPSLLVGGPADDRKSSNIRTIMAMMTNEGVSGCLEAGGADNATGGATYRSINARQCSLVHEYNEHSIKLTPAGGGERAWIKLSSSAFQPGAIPLETPVMVSVNASATDEERTGYAWPGSDSGGC